MYVYEMLVSLSENWRCSFCVWPYIQVEWCVDARCGRTDSRLACSFWVRQCHGCFTSLSLFLAQRWWAQFVSLSHRCIRDGAARGHAGLRPGLSQPRSITEKWWKECRWMWSVGIAGCKGQRGGGVGKERGGFREMDLRVWLRQKCVSVLERERGRE